MTPADVDEIEARAQAATAGPWRAAYHVDATDDECPFTLADVGGESIRSGANSYPPDCIPNAAFIAHARQDVPALVSALREAWKERDAARDALGETATWIDNWNPSFTEDDAWTDTQAKISAALKEGE